MPLAPWRSPLARALHHNRSCAHSRYLQLATVRLDGKPANRTVVFRGYLDGANALTFVTDRRSAKVKQMAHTPWGEACWYFTKSREQFRLGGLLTIVQADASNIDLIQARRRTWDALSEKARQQFSWPSPGQPKASIEAFSQNISTSAVPVQNFCLLILEPYEVTHLKLKGNPQDCTLYRWVDPEWRIDIINP